MLKYCSTVTALQPPLHEASPASAPSTTYVHAYTCCWCRVCQHGGRMVLRHPHRQWPRPLRSRHTSLGELLGSSRASHTYSCLATPVPLMTQLDHLHNGAPDSSEDRRQKSFLRKPRLFAVVVDLRPGRADGSTQRKPGEARKFDSKGPARPDKSSWVAPESREPVARLRGDDEGREARRRKFLFPAPTSFLLDSLPFPFQGNVARARRHAVATENFAAELSAEMSLTSQPSCTTSSTAALYLNLRRRTRSHTDPRTV